MADTTITITIPEAQWATLQKAFLFTDGEMGDTEATFNEAKVKAKVQEYLKNRVETYDRAKNVTVNYTTFTPS